MTDTTTTGEMNTPPTEMTHLDKLIVKDTCDSIIRCMSQFDKYTIKELNNDDCLYDYEGYDLVEKSTSIPIFSYYNDLMDGYCIVIPSHSYDSYGGNKVSTISLYNYKSDRSCKYDVSWSFPVSRFTKTKNISNAVLACELFYQHFCDEKDELGCVAVSKMLFEEYRKEPLFMKVVA